MSRTVRGALAVTILVLAIAGCSSPVEEGPTLAVETFYDHLNRSNYQEAMALYNAQAREILDDPEAASASGFAEWARLETKRGEVQEIEVLSEQAEETSATVEYEIVYRDGTRVSRKVSLTLEEGAWRLGLIG